jgi:predicted nucleotidyltransferase
MKKELDTDLENKIAEIARLLKAAGCTEVYFFGSTFRGESGPNSDVDFALRGLPAELFFKMMSIASDIMGREVDFVDLDEPDPIARYLETSGDMKRVA